MQKTSAHSTSYRPTIRTGYVGLNVLDMEITNMFQSKNLSTRTRPRKVVTATTYFPVVATPGGWDLAKLRADLGSYHDSKTFGLFSLARSHQNFRVLKCTMAQAPSTYNRPISLRDRRGLDSSSISLFKNNIGLLYVQGA